MKLSQPCFRAIALAMAVMMFSTSLPMGRAYAALVSTGEVVEQAAAEDDRARVMEFMSRQDVREQFEALGVDPDEARRRAATMSDREIQQIAGRLDEIPAGQGAAGVILLVIVVGFLVLLMTDILGLTDVFPFVKSQRTD